MKKEGGLPAPSQASQDTFGKPKWKPWGGTYSFPARCQAGAGQRVRFRMVGKSRQEQEKRSRCLLRIHERDTGGFRRVALPVLCFLGYLLFNCSVPG